MKLSETQRVALEALARVAEAGGSAFRVGNFTELDRTPHQIHHKTADSLILRGFAEEIGYQVYWLGRKVRITEAGLQFLAELDVEPQK